MVSSYWRSVRRESREAKERRRRQFIEIKEDLSIWVRANGGHIRQHRGGEQINLHLPAALLLYFPSTGTLKQHGRWRKQVQPLELVGVLNRRYVHGERKRGRRTIPTAEQ